MASDITAITATAGTPSLFDTAAAPAAHLEVQVLAWGFTGADVEHAVERAVRGEARAHWEPVDTVRSRDAACPFDPHDPAALAGERDGRLGHWAYAVYRAAPDA